MPLTFPAHQSVVVPLKMYFPSRFDGLALVVGAGAPDLLFGLGAGWLFAHSPWALPILVPAVVLYCLSLRRWALPGLFRLAPTIFGTDLRAYGAMSTSRPPLTRSLASAAVGVGSHQLWDSFTHAGHPVASALGLDQLLFTVGLGPLTRDFSIARLIQYSGHSFGSMITVGLLYLIVRRRSPGVLNWAEVDRLTAMRRPKATVPLSLVGVLTVAGIAVWPAVGGRGPFVLIVLWAVAVLVGGRLVERAYVDESSERAKPGQPAR